MTTPVSLAEWIASLRADLAEAVDWQEARENAAKAEGRPLRVPPLRLGELKLELEVRTTRESGGKAGLRFWVVSGDVDRKVAEGSTQKVTLTLAPLRDVHLGDDEGFLKD